MKKSSLEQTVCAMVGGLGENGAAVVGDCDTGTGAGVFGGRVLAGVGGGVFGGRVAAGVGRGVGLGGLVASWSLRKLIAFSRSVMEAETSPTRRAAEHNE